MGHVGISSLGWCAYGERIRVDMTTEQREIPAFIIDTREIPAFIIDTRAHAYIDARIH